MFKKTLLSLAVASSVGLAGCFSDGSTGGNANPNYLITDTTIDRSLVRPVYDPNPLLKPPSFPINADLILLLGASQSANYDFTGLSTGTSPADDAVNRLSGFSTSGAFSLKFDGPLIPTSVEANTTVFLVPLNVADAVEGVPGALPNTNPASIVLTNPFGEGLGLAPPNFRADVVSLDGGSNNAIRIVPLEPLEEGQKYLVIISDGVVGENNKPIARAVQDIELANGKLGNPALSSVKDILQLSDVLANTYLADFGTKSALAYTFTTNSDTDVLRALMAPPVFGQALGEKIGFTALLKAVRDNYPELNFSELTDQLADLLEISAGLGTTVDPSDLSPQELAALAAMADAGKLTENQKDPVTGEEIEGSSDIALAIVSAVQSGAVHLPAPRPNIVLSNEPASELATIKTLDLATNPIAQAATQLRVSQGAITLPYFQHLPGSDGSGIVEGYWTGNTALEASVNKSLTGSDTEEVFKFLRDIDGQLNVNGYFPFPQQQGFVTVPTTIYFPDPANTPGACGSDTLKGVTVYQHGITTDRSAAMLPAILIANQTCHAVVTIDLPLHGLGKNDAAPGAVGQIPGLSPLDETALKMKLEQTIGMLAPSPDPNHKALVKQLTLMKDGSSHTGERHFSYTADATLTPVPVDNLTGVSSGSLFINPSNMMGSTDNLRQATVDLLNLTATLQTMDIDGDFTPDLKGKPVHFVGHSLGGIVGTSYAALNNDSILNPTLAGTLASVSPNPADPLTYPLLKSVTLHNAGTQVTRILENSPAFSGKILGALATKEVTQGNSKFESFFYVYQSVADSGDAVSFAKALGATGTNVLVTEVTGDTVVPNEANVNQLGQAFPAPLAGTEPLAALIDKGINGSVDNKLADGMGISIMDTDNRNSAGMPLMSFFDGTTDPCNGANHGTMVSPVQGECDSSIAFTAMIAHTVGAIKGGAIPGIDAGPFVGPEVAGAINASLGKSETLERVLDQSPAE